MEWRGYTLSWWGRDSNSGPMMMTMMTMKMKMMTMTKPWGSSTPISLCNKNRAHTGCRTQAVSLKAHLPETHFPQLNPTSKSSITS